MNDLGHLPLGSLMGGALSPLTDTEIAITSAITLTQASIGRMHVCSGTSAAYTVGLPDVDGNAGKFIGFRMNNALTQLVTLQGNNSQNIDGQNTRVMWANEVAILYCDGAAWIKILGKSVPMTCVMKRTSAQSISSGVWTQVQTTTSVSDPTGQMADTTNGRVVIQRSGNYQCSAYVGMSVVVANTQIAVVKNSAIPSDSPNAWGIFAQNGTSDSFGAVSTFFGCSTNDWVAPSIQQGSGSARNTHTAATALPTIAVLETPSW